MMVDEILTGLWKVKDELSRKYEGDLVAEDPAEYKTRKH